MERVRLAYSSTTEAEIVASSVASEEIMKKDSPKSTKFGINRDVAFGCDMATLASTKISKDVGN